MQCHQNGVHISEVPKFIPESLSETTHAIQLTDPFDKAHPPIIPHQFSTVLSYFDVYSLNTAEYENEESPKIHLTAEESQWDLSTKDMQNVRLIC